jgi:hypothetical protein
LVAHQFLKPSHALVSHPAIAEQLTDQSGLKIVKPVR